jgi:hypothetical protein
MLGYARLGYKHSSLLCRNVSDDGKKLYERLLPEISSSSSPDEIEVSVPGKKIDSVKNSFSQNM